MRQRMLTWAKRAGIAIGGAILLFFLLDLLFPLRVQVPYAQLVMARDGKVLHAYLASDEQWRFDTRLDEITPRLRQAIISKEDRYFYQHPGVNPLAIGRALTNNIFMMRRTSGASTITMQVARMLNRKPRTYVNKLVEMFRALQLEKDYSKDEILQLYLNLVPYGSNIQGVKAAALLYFNKTPDQLSLAELTALSIIPNRPNSLVMGRDNDKIVTMRNQWLRNFEAEGLFSHEIIEDAIHEPLNAYRHAAPDGCPHFARRMLPAAINGSEIHTTLDAVMQQKAEDLVGNYSRSLQAHGIYNASVIIVDNSTRQVLAYVGSPNFNDRLHQGEVDGVKALRSPGSTLKPLVYGLAFDKGWLTPKSMIADVPVNFNGYAPENYDLRFNGNVTVEEALKQSLNIPAVKTLNELHVNTLSNTLIQAGFTSVWYRRKKMGLSMILGGCTVRLDEMAGLYAALANEGRYQPLVWLQPDSVWKGHKKQIPDTAAVQVLSPESAYMVTQILSELNRPDLPHLAGQASNVPRIAWKTGTSYGRKDGWSIGYNQQYTVAVWTGNFSGKGAPALSGAGIATPLLFRLFNAISHHTALQSPNRPTGLDQRKVCTRSGKPPCDYCTETTLDDYIPGVSSAELCQHVKPVWVSANGRLMYCTSCLPASGYQTKLYPDISPELAAYYEMQHIAYEQLPPHNPACTRMFEGTAPKIRSLESGMTYLITDPEHQQLQLSCTAANDVQLVYWYVNNKFAGSGKPSDKLFFVPDNNKVKISCTDDKGRNTDISILIKFI
jgi:penicillin-binding protein 1C